MNPTMAFAEGEKRAEGKRVRDLLAFLPEKEKRDEFLQSSGV